MKINNFKQKQFIIISCSTTFSEDLSDLLKKERKKKNWLYKYSNKLTDNILKISSFKSLYPMSSTVDCEQNSTGLLFVPKIS